MRQTAATADNAYLSVELTRARLDGGVAPRTDLRQAEQIQATAEGDVARQMTALAQDENLLRLLFTSGAFLKQVGADVRYSIFAGGGVRARIAISEAQRDAALAQYEGAVQTAFREVADAFAYLGTIGERQRAAAANRAAAEDTARLVEARYRGGVDSFLANLDAQRSLYSARQSETRLALEHARNRIALYRVLGGQETI